MMIRDDHVKSFVLARNLRSWSRFQLWSAIMVIYFLKIKLIYFTLRFFSRVRTRSLDFYHFLKSVTAKGGAINFCSVLDIFSVEKTWLIL